MIRLIIPAAAAAILAISPLSSYAQSGNSNTGGSAAAKQGSESTAPAGDPAKVGATAKKSSKKKTKK